MKLHRKKERKKQVLYCWTDSFFFFLIFSVRLLGLTRYTLGQATVVVRHHSEDSTVSSKPKRRKGKTPAGKLDEEWEGEEEERQPQGEQEPLERFPNDTNPITGEIGGPRGPEPTRYGDWERKGRVTDFWAVPVMAIIKWMQGGVNSRKWAVVFSFEPDVLYIISLKIWTVLFSFFSLCDQMLYESMVVLVWLVT